MISIGQNILLKSPWINASGFLGYRLPKSWNWPEPPGAFVTNPVSFSRRHPAVSRQLISYTGGFLLHNGLPNPGLRPVVKTHSIYWQRSEVPTWIHIISNNVLEINQMVRSIESHAEISVVEINLPDHLTNEQALAWIMAAFGELPLVVQVPLHRVNEGWLDDLPGLGVSAVSLGPPRGVLPGSDGRLLAGRIYGPSLLPMTFHALHSLLRIGLPVIAGGGVYRIEDGNALLSEGAVGVMLDGVLWNI